MKALLLAGFVAAGWAGSAQASFIDTALETSAGVVFTGAGSFNTTGLTSDLGYVSGNAFIQASQSVIAVGNGAIYSTLTGPSSFGSGIGNVPTTSSGDSFLIVQQLGNFGVPRGYVSGATLSSTLTFAGATFASLGVTPGTYVYDFNSGVNADTFTLQIGPAATATVPETTSLAVLGLALAGLTGVGRRRVA